MEQQEKKWYVVRAISGKEKKAKEYIESEMAKRGWSNDVPTVLIPTEQVVSIRNGKKVIKDRNYFPGYVIIEANLRDEIIPVIQNLPNVLDFLREREGQPIPMRQAEINRILGKMDAQADGVEAMERFFFSSFTSSTVPEKLLNGPSMTFTDSPLELSFSQVEKEQ